MNTTIYVFSGTGTLLAAAENISDVLMNTRILSIASIMKKNNEVEVMTPKVGFIFPCYFDGMPQIVINFIRRINLDKAKYIFGIVTAGASFGNSLELLNSELIKKGKKLDYGKVLFLSSNNIAGWHYAFTYKHGKRLAKGIKKFNAKSIEIALDIQNLKLEIHKGSFIMDKLSHVGRASEIAKDTRHWDSEFKANHNCTGCPTCMKVCPVENIKIEDNKPIFMHNCQRCTACIQYCPNNAINIKGKEVRKPKYHHPEYHANRIIKFLKDGVI